jgi:hypothetical protein
MSETQTEAFHTLRRDKTTRKRRVIRPCLVENAAQAIGRIEPGLELYGFSKGQFSKIDILLHLLNQTGPAHVAVATWTAASKEIEDTRRMVASGAILSLRFLVDFSFPRRQPRYYAELRDAFGDDTIRVSKTHAKFLLIRNDQWNLVVRTSMNLNANKRFENFEISDDPAMADFLESVIADVFAQSTSAETFGERPSFHTEKFNDYGTEPVAFEDTSAFGVCLDDPMNPDTNIGLL